MTVLLGLDAIPPGLHRPVITMGSFDGIHRGHQKLLERVVELAAENDGTPVLLTFEPHPQQVVAPGTAPPLLTGRAEKLPLIEEAGIALTIILTFNRELSELAAEVFVRQVLVDRLGVAHLVLGHDHAFGRERRGREELLQRLAPELGFGIEVVDAVLDDGVAITSTVIRNLLAAGEVERAAHMLGRPYSLGGLVVRGEGRGRELGFPTANLALEVNRKCMPGDGIYAVRVRVRGSTRSGACSIGRRPTFGSGDRTIEVYLIDFEDDIYGDRIEVTFQARLRDELAFENPQELVEQMRRDVENVQRLMSQEEY